MGFEDKRTLDNIDEVPSKRRKFPIQRLGRIEDNLDYWKDQEVPLIWILYNWQFYASVSPDHILKKAPKGEQHLWNPSIRLHTCLRLQDPCIYLPHQPNQTIRQLCWLHTPQLKTILYLVWKIGILEDPPYREVKECCKPL